MFGCVLLAPQEEEVKMSVSDSREGDTLKIPLNVVNEKMKNQNKLRSLCRAFILSELADCSSFLTE